MTELSFLHRVHGTSGLAEALSDATDRARKRKRKSRLEAAFGL